MRKLRKNIVRTWVVMALALLLGLTGLSSVAAQAQEGSPVPDGTTLETGQLAVWEISDHPSTAIFAGYVPEGANFTVANSAGFNAWAPYSTVESALDGACRNVAQPRLSDHGFTAVTVNDQPFTNLEDCLALEPFGSAPEGDDGGGSPVAQSGGEEEDPQEDLPRRPGFTGELRSPDTVKESDPAGEIIVMPAGSIGVQRVVDNSAGTIDVDVVPFEEETEVVTGPGMVAYHLWYGYSSVEHAYRDACGEANAREAEAAVRGNWDFGYTVRLNGKAVPDSCR